MAFFRPVPIQPISPGRYPTELLAACRMVGVLPGDLHDWALRQTTVTLILASGRKVIIPLEGNWAPARLSRPDSKENNRWQP